MGAILIFAFYVLFQRFGFRYVLIAGGLLPALAFLGTLCLQESPIFAQRLILIDHYEDDLLKLTLQERGNQEKALRKCQQSQSQKSTHALPDESGSRSGFLIQEPELYKPLVLIFTITCLQHFSGFTFTEFPAPNFRAFEKRARLWC